MTIEAALGGLSMSLFCALAVMFLVGLGIVIGALIVNLFFFVLDWIGNKIIGGE